MTITYVTKVGFAQEAPAAAAESSGERHGSLCSHNPFLFSSAPEISKNSDRTNGGVQCLLNIDCLKLLK